MPDDRRAAHPDRVFYDGSCGLCHATVRFVLRHDAGGRFRFAPLAGTTLESCLDEERRRDLPDSVVVLTADGRLLARSAAALYLLRSIGGAWARLARALAFVPPPLADLAYWIVAATRRRLWRRPENQCPLVPAELRSRFDP